MLDRPTVRRIHVLVSLLLALAVGTGAAPARADAIRGDMAAKRERMRALARLTSLTTTNVFAPDTVWIGHVLGNTGLPGDPGGYGPFHIGRGGYRVNIQNQSGSGHNNGYWDFDSFNPGETDTLQGWWSLVTPYQSVGSSNLNDRKRSFFGFDYGNQGNYRGNGTRKRTFGVLGYWHRDRGTALGPVVPGTNPVAPGWLPLSGSYSAWCGLRGHGDQTAMDPVTGNAINCAVIARTGDDHFLQIGSMNPNGTDANFPGYGSQWDQMMYRDFAHTAGRPMTVSFKYTTRMSDGVQSASNLRIGWFDKDPLLAVSSYDGNFISSSDAGIDAPIDSFMVYVGAPVNDAACAYTNTLVPTVVFRPVHDTQRRWFSEVLRIDQAYFELLSAWGTTAGTQNPSFTIPATVLDAIGASVRIVFRVKTNRGWDDEDTYVSGSSSGGAGAAIVDDVSVKDGGDPAQVTDFEDATDIDNTAAPNVAWRTTGKPPGVFFHWHNLQAGSPGGYTSGLPYSDPCGDIGGRARECNMSGNIVTPGNHDMAGERPGGTFGANDQDRQDWFMSPTINLMSNGNGPGYYNGMGIDQEIADARSEVWLAFDVYINLLQFFTTANGFRVGYQTYPAIQPNGSRCWQTPVKPMAFEFYDQSGCYNGQIGAVPVGALGRTDGTYVTVNANGVPDSMRAFVEHLTACFRRPVTSATCSPSAGPYVGMYLDNLSIGFIDGAEPPGLSVMPWNLWQDAFPTNSDNGFVGSPAFDTLAAQVRTGLNRAPSTGDLTRNVIPGDTMSVMAPGSSVRVDLVFRILPGPGNYFGAPPVLPQKLGFLKQRPDGPAQAKKGDGSFWGSYLADIGLFGSGGPHTGGGKAMGDFSGHADRWDPNVWLSARCDTAETLLFPCDAVDPGASALHPGYYQSTYHEDELDPTLSRGSAPLHGGGRVSLGIVKPRCILISATPGSRLDQTNIDCGTGTVPPSGLGYAAAWTSQYLPAIGGVYHDPTCPACPVGSTKEFTKIIPDGQLTAGSHVEYFFRKTYVGNYSAFQLLPDTTLILWNVDGSLDGHRWASMNVLPDRWKDPNYGGSGMACMLVVNAVSRWGEMPVWDNMATTLGLASAAKRGAGTGYHVGSTQEFPYTIAELIPGQQVSLNLGQKGTLYDVYDVLAADSNVPAGRLGGRYASQPTAGNLVGRQSAAGPTHSMLQTYYRHLFVLTASFGGPWGPSTDASDDDIGLMTDFMADPDGTAAPRTVIVTGSEIVAGQSTAHPTFFPNHFGATLRNSDYRALSANSNDVPDLIPNAGWSPASPGAIYGVFSPCWYSNDVLNVNTTIPGAAGVMFYENVGGGGPYIAAVYAPAGGLRLANTLVTGWAFGLSGQTGSRYTLSRGGHHVLWLNALTSLIGGVCGQPLTAPSGIGDGFTSGSRFVDFMDLRSENPMRSGEARIAFGITRTEKIEVRVYDVAGRLMKTVAHRVFAAGQEHVVRWDGTDHHGRLVPRGVYFYQLRSPSFVSEKKLTVLRD